ncbi:hypothetical protein B0A48_07118 [Cryoendolithus antarcticus]|uniref:Uncharacterized protein n=1 Tax=Cryoendolithus antarcticus TaxID=1507870 RepID=A0A1V8T844_9PEZI|nr:hypothetical protein B0A48_07118 [Cryoendolithus antarcticus]
MTGFVSRKRKRPELAHADAEPSSDDEFEGPLTPQHTVPKSKRYKSGGQFGHDTAHPDAPSLAYSLQQSLLDSPQEQSAPSDIVPDSDVDDVLEPSDPSIPRPTRCFLFTLAVEQQIDIFEMATTPQKGGRYLDKPTWNHRQEIIGNKNSSYIPRDFPAPKVNEWLLSKQYFLQAARA